VIGDLARRVTLERPDAVDDAGGGFAVSWTPISEAWARIVSSRASEGEEADDLVSRVSHAVRMRWRSDVGAGWRLVFDGRYLRVRAAVDPDGAKRWLDLDCEEEIR
jgi:SPP1 family predicted phage head-tail adaptor